MNNNKICTDEFRLHKLGDETTDIMTLGVFERDNRVLVSSRDVARVFEKRHDNVLKDVRELGVSSEFSLLNFEESIYRSDRGKEYPEYLMTRDGFTILVMGYTGEKAMRFKEAYINAFNEMERRLTQSIKVVTKFTLDKADWLKISEYISNCGRHNRDLLLIALNNLAPGMFDETIFEHETTISVDIPENFGQLLKCALMKNAMSQNDLSKMTGIPKSGISQYINGKNKPSEKTLNKITSVLELTFN